MMTWLALAGEWQRDWARMETALALTEVIKQHAAGSGIANLWEQQLLNTPGIEHRGPIRAGWRDLRKVQGEQADDLSGLAILGSPARSIIAQNVQCGCRRIVLEERQHD